jgi:hypothetical protein
MLYHQRGAAHAQKKPTSGVKSVKIIHLRPNVPALSIRIPDTNRNRAETAASLRFEFDCRSARCDNI